MGNQQVSSIQESLNDKEYDGSDYLVDTELQNGPLFNRKCTDVICLLVFWLFIGVYGYTCAYSIQESHPEKLLRPVNGDGQLCGVKNDNYDLSGFPNLFYIIKKSDKSARAVCVDHCPKKPSDGFSCHGTSFVKPSECQNHDFYVGYGTFRVLKRFCLPNPEELPGGFDEKSFDNIIGSFGLDDVQEIAEDVVEGQYVFLITFVTCIAITVFYAFLIQKLTGLFVWTSVIATGLGIFLLAFLLDRHNRKNKGSIESFKKEKGEGASSEKIKAKDKTQDRIQIVVYCIYGLGVAFFIGLCCLWKNLAIAIAVLKTSSVIVMRNMRMLFMPFLSSAIIVMWTSFWISMFILLVSSAKITQPTAGSQYKTIEMTTLQKQFMWIQIFAFFWIMEFVQALFQYAVIVGTCTWYFTSTQDTRGNFSLCQGFVWGLKYNQGSLAFGSFLLAVIWVLRIILEIINKQVEKVKDENAVAKCIINCTRCCLDCFHRFIKFVNENAYIQVALTGENFCTSAMQAFVLALKNAASFLITNGIGAFIYFLGKATISIVNTAIGYLIITYVPDFEEDIDQPIPFLLLIFGMSYMMATTFMEVYSGVSLAVLQCFYADVDICNQTGKIPLDNRNRPAEMNHVIGLIAKSPSKPSKKK